MAAPALTRRRTVATLLWQVDDKVAFAYGDEDRPEYHYESTADWVDMGEPRVITLSVTSGDQLND